MERRCTVERCRGGEEEVIWVNGEGGEEHGTVDTEEVSKDVCA